MQVRWGSLAWIAGVALATAWLVFRGRPESGWLTVDGDAHAVPGLALMLNIRIDPPLPSQLLVADLHWSTRRREPMGFLTGGRPQRLSGAIGSCRVEIPVPERDEMGFVQAVVYVSPSGRWEDRIRSASTEPIPVRSAIAAGDRPETVHWAVHDHLPDPGSQPSASTSGRALVAALWLFVAVRMAWVYRVPVTNGNARSSRERRWMMVAFCGALLAAAWQALAMDSVLGDDIRRLTIDHRLYFEREWLQKLTTLAIAVGAAGVIAWLSNSSLSRSTRAVLLGLASLLALSALSIVSLHSVDRLADLPFWDMPVIDWLKIAVTLVAVVGSLLPARHA